MTTTVTVSVAKGAHQSVRVKITNPSAGAAYLPADRTLAPGESENFALHNTASLEIHEIPNGVAAEVASKSSHG